jgi:hypothetical protein
MKWEELEEKNIKKKIDMEKIRNIIKYYIL